ncbi:hypothetical protein VTN00DRAFT_8258 [Thermoascus crustaceus]|uniref:uncharacterized protein n=1 Tax=Thermoascus crustaceus TaxID=5088 RepID=UPI00374321EF
MANASKTVLGPGRVLGYSSLAAVEWKNGPPLLKNPGSNCGYTQPCSALDHFKTSSGFWMSDARHIRTGSARTRVGGASRVNGATPCGFIASSRTEGSQRTHQSHGGLSSLRSVDPAQRLKEACG